MIRRPSDTWWRGNDVFNATAERQAVRCVVPAAGTGVFLLRIQNAEPIEQAFVVTGNASAFPDVLVRYYDSISEGHEITDEVTTVGWMTPTLSPGRSRLFRVEVSDHGSWDGVPVVPVVETCVSAASVSDADKRRDTVLGLAQLSNTEPIPQIMGLSALNTARGVQVTLSLSAGATVQARVRNIAGRPVRTVCTDKPCPAGTNTLLWDGRSDGGLPVPSGLYLVEVLAKSPVGTQSRALTQVRMGR
jgi:hypothetical protein